MLFRSAFRPYYFFSQSRKPLIYKGFWHRSQILTPNLTHYKLSQTWLGWLTERRVHNSRKLFGFIILDLGVDVHRNFAVLVTREVLNRFGINRGIYQIGDIRCACENEGVACSLSIVSISRRCSSGLRYEISTAGVMPILPSSTSCNNSGSNSFKRIYR